MDVGSSLFSLLSQLPQKILLVAKVTWKTIILLCIVCISETLCMIRVCDVILYRCRPPLQNTKEIHGLPEIEQKIWKHFTFITVLELNIRQNPNRFKYANRWMKNQFLIFPNSNERDCETTLLCCYVPIQAFKDMGTMCFTL